MSPVEFACRRTAVECIAEKSKILRWRSALVGYDIDKAASRWR